MSVRSNPRLGFSFENLMWYFTRISGIAIILLAIFGFFAAFFMDARTVLSVNEWFRWSFFPNPNHVVNTDIPDVTQGWANAYWQIMQMLIVFFGATHGINGLRMIIEDFIGPSWGRLLLRSLLFAFWIFLLIMAVYVILAS